MASREGFAQLAAFGAESITFVGRTLLDVSVLFERRKQAKYIVLVEIEAPRKLGYTQFAFYRTAWRVVNRISAFCDGESTFVAI